MKRPTITCHCCHGKGIEPLPDTYWSALQLVAKASRYPHEGMSAPDLAQRLGITPSNANNRLEALRKLRFVKRWKVSKRWVYVLR